MNTLKSLEFILIGSFLGLSAGISPGPLLTLVIAQTLRHDKKEGIKIAISPLITDAPIILITLWIFYKLSQFDIVLGVISLMGGIYLAYLGYESMKTEGLSIGAQDSRYDSLAKGVITNFLSPHPYLFWATIGTPFVFKAFEINLLTVILFFLSFYALLIGSKVIVATIVAHSKKFIGQKSYLVIMKLFGIVLFVFSLLLFYDGIKHLKTH
jgi:threonine/homoserine/homoserine lactone efflux protein